MTDEVKKPHYVKNITVHLDKEIKDAMVKYPEVNWSVVAREAIREYLKKRNT